jgi:hypothetical protein
MRIVILILVAAACALTGAAHAGERGVTVESLLREMVDRDRMASWPHPAYVTHQASSYDRRSKTPDDPAGWFANDDWSHFIRAEVNSGRHEWVMMDADGPGCVTRIWWGGMMPPPDRRIRFYLDGADTPAIEAPAYRLLVGPALVGRPLAIENAHGPTGAPGGMNLFLPIPYAKHCKITWDDLNPKDPALPPDGRWYNIEYRTYAAGAHVTSFTMAALEKARPTIDAVCKELLNPDTPAGGETVTLSQRIEPGAECKLPLPAGPHAVRTISAQIQTSAPDLRDQALRSTILRISWDGEPSVWCPFGDFFGSGVGLNVLQSWYRTVSQEGELRCRWTMPYRKSGEITVQNVGRVAETISLRAVVGPWRWTDRSMHFHAGWRQQNPLPTRPFSDWNYVTVDGQGVYMGDTLSVWNPVPDWWGEGDEKIWVDGESFPSHFGTGSEDYYCYSYGDNHLFQGPFSNQVRCDGPGNKGNTVVTRTRCLDAIPFARSLKFDMEVWHWKDCKEVYAVATYWYAKPGAKDNRPGSPEEAQRGLPGAVGDVHFWSNEVNF